MFSFLLPKHVKHGRQFIKDAKKILAYKRDLWSAATVADFETHLTQLEKAVKSSDARSIEAAAQQLDTLCGANLPAVQDGWIRENVEVFLVAIVIALAVRTYFLQPFTIPTGSMQPTLNGILGQTTDGPAPNVVVRIFQAAWFGRSWVDVVAKDDCTVIGEREFKSLLPFIGRTPLLGETFGIFTRTEIITATHRYVIKDTKESVDRLFRIPVGSSFKAGQPIVRGFVDTGDHVFVDKFTYNFRRPRRGDVFVFSTQKLPTIDRRRPSQEPNDPTQFDEPLAARLADTQRTWIDMGAPSQYYIKRLAGLPGDELRIDPPALFINGKPAEDSCFRRVSEMKEPGYGGYGLGFPSFLLPILRTPNDAYTVPAKHYLALGDNSYHSSDSRDWGPVPQQNIMGRGVFVYWPFGSHWGLIR